MHQHQNLSLRTPKQISVNHAKAFSKANMNAFFAKLNTVFDENTFKPQRIWNIDKTGYPIVSTKTVKVVTMKGSKKVGQKTSAEKGTKVSLAFGVSVTGQSIPPFYFFLWKNMQKVFMDNAAPGAVGIANESGWMTAQDFVKFMAHIIKHSNALKESPIRLLLDNHTFYLSLEVIDMAINHGIMMVSFPSH